MNKAPVIQNRQTLAMTGAQPRAIIFDWDNTLVDAWSAVVAAVNQVRAFFGQEFLTREEVIENSARSARNLFRDWYGDAWERAHDIFYGSYEKDHLKFIKALPGATELLVWLKQQDIPSFVVSNKRGDILRAEADYLDWNLYFRALAGSLDTLSDKPERDPVDWVLGQADMKADDPAIWFVGDTQADVTCARNAGCTPVLISALKGTGGHAAGAGLVFSGCQELLEMLYSCSQQR